MGGADASADTVVDEADDPAQQSGGRNGYGDEDDDEEGAGDGEDYLDRLDAELNAMYQDYQARTRRRTQAMISQDEDGKTRSKKKRRAEINEAVAAGDEEDPEVSSACHIKGQGRTHTRTHLSTTHSPCLAPPTLYCTGDCETRGE